jgi:DNA-binding MarR family transcriptional regulator
VFYPGPERWTRRLDEHRRVPDRYPEITANELADVARFRIALRHFEHRTAQAVKRCGLTPQRYLVLLVVATTEDAGGATVTTLSRDLEMPQTTVTDLVARAVVSGLLERRQGTDGRVSHLEVTLEGQERLLAAVAALGAERAQLRQTLVELTSLI